MRLNPKNQLLNNAQLEYNHVVDKDHENCFIDQNLVFEICKFKYYFQIVHFGFIIVHELIHYIYKYRIAYAVLGEKPLAHE
jgi:hypothetical protein